MIQEATLLGRIGKKDTKTLKDGSEMTTLYLATNRNWLDKNGVKQELTVWHNVNFYSKLSDIAKQYAHVGNLVYIKGDINHKKIEQGDRMGQWSYSVTANTIKLLPSNRKNEVSSESKAKAYGDKVQEKDNEFYAKDSFDDDIPF